MRVLARSLALVFALGVDTVHGESTLEWTVLITQNYAPAQMVWGKPADEARRACPPCRPSRRVPGAQGLIRAPRLPRPSQPRSSCCPHQPSALPADATHAALKS